MAVAVCGLLKDDGQYLLYHDRVEQIAFFGMGQVRRSVKPD